MKFSVNTMKASPRFIMYVLLLAIASLYATAQDATSWKSLKADINLFIANDLGRNGYYDQRPIAELMGNMAETIGPECIVAAGDVHHFNGVASVDTNIAAIPLPCSTMLIAAAAGLCRLATTAMCSPTMASAFDW